MDAKALAKDIRAAIRAATRTPGDVLHGLNVSVRYRTASLMQAIDVTVKDMDVRWLYVPHPDAPGGHQLTPYAQGIKDRLEELARPALTWANGRNTFTMIEFGQVTGDLPDAQEDAADRAHLEARIRDLTERLADALTQLADPAPRCANGHGPMTATAHLREEEGDEEYVGALHACTTPGCGAAVLVPTRTALARWAQRTRAARAPRLGPRHGTAGLAVVR